MPVYRCTACGLLSGGKPIDSQNDSLMKYHKCRIMNVKIQFKEANFTENYDMKVSTGSTVAELKGDIELLTGIPTLLQQVCFNDEAILYDTTCLHDLNLVNHCTFSLTVRHDWAKLVEAVLKQDFDQLIKLGITEDSDFKSPAIDYITDPIRRKEALRFRGTVALIIASHRGMARLVKQMISAGIDVNGQTQFKRSALHIVAAKGQSEILDLLIHNGANIDLIDYNGETPLDIANRLEQQQSARQLFLFRWQQRAKNAQPSFADIPMFPHQYFDSDLTIHFSGNQGQVYMMHVPPPGEGDRWKPRKNPEIVKDLSPTRTVAAAQIPSSATTDDKSAAIIDNTSKPPAPVYFTSTAYGPTRGRPKSPSFAYADGIAVVGNKKEGKLTFEDWLTLKKTGPKPASSGFGTREQSRQSQRRPQSSATVASNPMRLLSASIPDGRRLGIDTAVNSRSSARNRWNNPDSTASNSVDNSPLQTYYKSSYQTPVIDENGNDSATLSKPAEQSTECLTEYESRRHRRTTSTKVVPVHEMVYKYKRVKSAADNWLRFDREKSSMTSLWL